MLKAKGSNKHSSKTRSNFFLKLFFATCLVFAVPAIADGEIFGNLVEEQASSYQLRHLLGESQGNCTPAAINEFPSDGLTREQRKAGWITVHVFLTCYCFIVLSIVCDDYFVPGIQTLVKRLQLSEDVAGASFMAITSASPELFINCVGTFVTEGDIGVGTVVGSNVFNILAAPACCGLFARMSFQFERWSILRDGFMYAVSVIMLIATLYDDKVYWYEALILVLAYVIYIAAMYFDKTIRDKISICCGESNGTQVNPEMEKLKEENGKQLTHIQVQHRACKADKHLSNQNNEYSLSVTNEHSLDIANNSNTFLIKHAIKSEQVDDDEQGLNVWTFPSKQPLHEKLWWVLIWPILFVLKCTVPNCRKRGYLYPLTLLMCIFWIGSTSYLLAWLITAIGDTISIPDSVMGLTFLAVGSSMPEIVSCIIVSRQGQGIMGMSSALGANTFEVLLCLGLPWLIKTCFNPKVSGSHWIDINSSGLAYNATCLLSTLVFLYICFFCNRFRLDWKVGLICLIMYGVFLVVGTLIELNFFFPVNFPTCN